MDGQCELAPRGEAKAFLVPYGSDGGGDLWVVANGELPTPCWDVGVQQSPLDVWPPQFAIVACPSGGFCPEVVTPYSAVGRFSVGSKPDSIRITDAAGPREVQVEVAPDAALGAPDGSVVGYSRAPISFEEAVNRAASRLPRPHPNAGVSMTIDEIWYTDGGIVGPVLYVRGKSKGNTNAMVTPEQARRDTIDALGITVDDAKYITQEFLDEVLKNPVEPDWEEELPEEVEEDAVVLGAGPPGQTPRRAWAYRPVKIGIKWAFYWWKNGQCSSESGVGNYDWYKTKTYCSNTGELVWEIRWWA